MLINSLFVNTSDVDASSPSYLVGPLSYAAQHYVEENIIACNKLMINTMHCIILNLQLAESDYNCDSVNIHRIEQTFPIPNMSCFAYAPIDSLANFS
jgi:hypothetical protein